MSFYNSDHFYAI